MGIGAYEIVLCVLVAVGAMIAYGAWVNFICPGRAKALRTGGLAFLGLPALCVIAAAVTPPDMVTLMFVAIPLCALYGLAVGIWLIIRYRKPRRES